jgi:AraC-like DNA-binding protein
MNKKNRILKPDLQTIQAVHDTMMKNLGNSMPPIKDLANKACLSPSKLSSLFKEVYQTSIYQYHLQARITLAKALLLANELTVTQIAYRVGFRHHQSFIKSFIKQTGLSPKQFQDKAEL